MHMCIRFNFFADLREIESEKSTFWVKQTNPMDNDGVQVILSQNRSYQP